MEAYQVAGKEPNTLLRESAEDLDAAGAEIEIRGQRKDHLRCKRQILTAGCGLRARSCLTYDPEGTQ